MTTTTTTTTTTIVSFRTMVVVVLLSLLSSTLLHHRPVSAVGPTAITLTSPIPVIGATPIAELHIVETTILLTSQGQVSTVAKHNPLHSDSGNPISYLTTLKPIDKNQLEEFVNIVHCTASNSQINLDTGYVFEALGNKESLKNHFKVVFLTDGSKIFLVTRYIQIEYFQDEAEGYYVDPLWMFNGELVTHPAKLNTLDESLFQSTNTPDWPGNWVAEMTTGIPMFWTNVPPSITVTHGDANISNGSKVFIDIDDVISCEDHPDAVSEVNIVCNETSHGLNVTFDYDVFGLECQCLATYKHVCYQGAIPFKVYTPFRGPESVVITALPTPEASVISCHPIPVYCDVPIDSSHPQEMVRLVIGGIAQNPDRSEKMVSTNVTRYYFEARVRPSTTGLMVCEASNPELAANLKTASYTFTPPDTFVILTMDNESPIVNKSNHCVILGDVFHGQCNVTGAIPPNMTLTMTCAGNSNSTTTEPHVTLSFNITLDMHEVACECFVTTPTGCFEETTLALFDVAYGPTSVAIATPFLTDAFALSCDVRVTCGLNISDINPAARVVLRSASTVDLRYLKIALTSNNEVIQFLFDYNTVVAGEINVTCVAGNWKYDNVVTKTMPLLFSPTDIQITLGDERIVTSMEDVYVLVGETVSVNCLLGGGVSPEMNTTANCGSRQNNTIGTQSSLRFQFDQVDDGTICSCTVSTETNCLQETKTFTLLEAFGPSEIGGSVTAPQSNISVCDTVEVTCEVRESLAKPMPSTMLRLDPGRYLNVTTTEDKGDLYSYVFEVMPDAIGTTRVSCVTKNPMFPQLGAEVLVEIFVQKTYLRVNGIAGERIDNNTVYKVLPGSVFNPECLLEGVAPPSVTLTFECVESAFHPSAPRVEVIFLVETRHHDKECHCVATSPSLCYHEEFYFSLSVAFGPSDVVFGPPGVVEYSICPDVNDTVSIWCAVNTTDVFPKPEVVLKGLPGGDLEVTSSTETSGVFWYYFDFTPTPGSTTLTCSAANTIRTDVIVNRHLAIFVNEPPTQPPSVKIAGGRSLPSGSAYQARLGFTQLECTVGGGNPAASNVTLTCGEFTNTTDGVTTTLTVEVRQSPKEFRCVCTAKHVSGCYHPETELTIVSTYQPNTVTVGPLGVFDLCAGEVSQMTVYCEMDRDDGNPLPTFDLRRGASYNDLDPYMNTTFGNAIRHHFKFRPEAGGNVPAKCVATNTVFTDLVRQSGFTYTVHEPPHDAPTLTANGKLIPTSTLNVSLGISLHVVCTVEGGFPNVTDVTLECDGDDEVTAGIESSLTLRIVRDSHRDMCTCSARHVSGCYTMRSQFTIEVWEPTVIVDYELNANKEGVRLNSGSSTRFYCMAEGIPLPSLSIRGLYSKDTLPAPVTTVNHYTRKIDFTKSMACNESDTYVCVAENGVADDSSLDATVVCAIERVVPERRRQRDRQAVRPGNVITFIFEIISRPPPTRIVLFKLTPTTGGGGGRAKRQVSKIEIDHTQYNTNFTVINLNMAELKLDFFDINTGDVNDYRLEVENGLGGLDIDFQTILQEGDDEEADGGLGMGVQANNGHGTILTIVVIICIVFMVVVIVVMVIYYKWCGKNLSKKLKDKRRRNQPKQRIRMVHCGKVFETSHQPSFPKRL